MRASYYLIGAMLGRFGEASVPMPGGCNFGARPIDQHIKGFRSLGASIEIKNGLIEATAEQLFGNSVYLDVVSVGATLNIMFAAVLASGVTRIENAAKEPHIVDVANFLNLMGADIKGAGTDVIRITGVDRLTGGEHTIIPDQIEAGTFMALAAATRGDIVIRNVIPKHLEPITAKLQEMGVFIEVDDDFIHVQARHDLIPVNVKTIPYPGFPTDMQPQFVALLSTINGVSVVTEGVWDNRFQYIDELKKMGVDIKTDGHIAVVQGTRHLTGAPLKACDLRAGAAMVIAALAANGRSEITNVNYIDRGYSRFEEKIRALGGQISRMTGREEISVEKVAGNNNVG
jgi:UDP-N-acetylglucosamine 1-carboxyvinyltransferase